MGTRVNTVASSKGTSYTYGYDGLGNVTANGKHTFSFDNASRMGKVNNLGIDYFYDGRGHRIVEKSASETKITLRNEKGQVMYQQNLAQNKAYKYYRLGSLLVAESEDPCTLSCGIAPVLAARTADADHSLSKADIYIKQIAAAVSGLSVNYTLEIGNNGPDAALNVEFRHSIPGGQFSSYTPSKGGCVVTGRDMVCKLGKLEAGEKVIFNGAISNLALEDYKKTAISRVISSTTDSDTTNNAIIHKSGGGGGGICPTEKAVAGTVAENSLETFRDYRDNVLAESQFGPEIITAYYRSSPDLVKSMDQHAWFLYYMRGIVGILFVIAWIGLSPLQWASILGLMALAGMMFVMFKRLNSVRQEV